jgi:hypothetical protein
VGIIINNQYGAAHSKVLVGSTLTRFIGSYTDDGSCGLPQAAHDRGKGKVVQSAVGGIFIASASAKASS